jgi:hypothetical protein
MGFGENMTWLAIGLAAAAYVSHRHIEKRKVTMDSVPSSEKEVDPTRWRHDGTQPLQQTDGNRFIDDSYFVTEADLKETMNF